MAKRYLMWTLTTFVLAVLLCTYLPLEVMLAAALVILIAAVPVAIIRFSLKRLILPCQVAFIAAVLLFTATQYNSSKTIDELRVAEAEVSGIVTDLGTNAAGDLIRYEIQVTHIGDKELPKYNRFKFYLYCADGAKYLPGDRFQGTPEFFEGETEYGMGKENFVFLSSYQSGADDTFIAETKDTVHRILYNFRTAVQERLIYGQEKTNGLLNSICFGNTSNLDSGLNVSFRRIGLSHVTSVSGFHLTFAVALFNYLFILVGLNYRVRYILDIFVAVFFTLMVGFPLSCIRACIMLSLLSLGMALDLFPDGLTSLSVAAFLIVVVSPLAVRDVGFMLSVSATAGILLLYAPAENFLFPKKISGHPWVNWIYRKITGILACSIAATIATLPIVIIVFGSVSLIGPVANAVLTMPIEALFTLGILTVMLGWIPGVGKVLGFLCDILYNIIDSVADFMGRFSFSSVSGWDLAGIIVLVLFAVIFGVALYDFLRHGRRSFLALFLLLLLFCGCFRGIYSAAHPDDQLEIAFINVGQGDCTVISRDHRAVIVDYGGSSQERYNLIEYLRKRDIYIVELLAFTHLHSDHTNGLNTLLRNVYVDLILYPELGFDSPESMSMIRSQNHRTVLQDESITVLDDVTVSVMTKTTFDETLANENERCVCYRVSYGGASVLLTGDLEGEAEMKLLDYDLESTLLKVAHHGSDTSSIYPFIKAVAPEIAVISVGENNYGLPDAAVIKRLETVCDRVLKTLDGNIVFRTDGITMERVS